MTTKDKIVFLTVSRFISGAERVGADIADFITRDCNGLAIVSPEIKKEFSISNAHTISLPIKYSKISRSKLTVLLLLVYSFLTLFKFRANKKTVFYCNDIESVFLVGMSRLFCRCRVIWHVHDVYKLDRWLTFRVLKLAMVICNDVIVLTGANQRRFNSIVNSNSIYVVPNFCRLPLKVGMVRRELIEGGAIRFCYLGQITPCKGVLEIVGIVKKMNEVGWNIFLDIGGRPLFEKDKEYLDSMLKKIDQDKRIKYVGEVLDPVDFFSDKDFLICFSTNEPFGLVIIEAISQGLRVISKRGDGPNDILKDFESLLLDDNACAEDQIGDYLKSIVGAQDTFKNSADLFLIKYGKSQFYSKLTTVLNVIDVG